MSFPGKSIAGHALRSITSSRMACVLGEPFFRLLGLRGKKCEIDLVQVKSVLIVRLDEIGDMVMTTPFLRELRRLLPAARITLVVKPALRDLMALCPYTNEVLTYDWNTSVRFSQIRRHGRALRLVSKYLWHRSFDLAIVPRWGIDHYHAAFVSYFSGARWRVGYSETVNADKKQLNGGLDHLFTHTLDDSEPKHEVERGLDLIRFLGGATYEDRLELWLGKEDRAFAEDVLASNGFCHHELLIAFAPGAGAPKRVWPFSNFIELALWLNKEYHARILVIGGSGEEAFGRELQQQLGNAIINVAGQTTLRQTAALLEHCDLYIGNDTGPMHIAAAVEVQVIEISCHPQNGSALHPNSPILFGPWGVPHFVLRPAKAIPPCTGHCTAGKAHCILDIKVDQVKKAAAALLLQSSITGSASEAVR